MARKKKVTIKHFLNKSLGPGPVHPLYIMVTYNRKNTQFKSRINDDFIHIEGTHTTHKIDHERRIIRAIVEHEINLHGDNYEVKGLGNKYETYGTPLLTALSEYLKHQLGEAAMRSNPVESYVFYIGADRGMTFDMLYSGAQRLFDDLPKNLPENFDQDVSYFEQYCKFYNMPDALLRWQFDAVIDWLDGTTVADYTSRLAQLYPGKPEKIKERIKFINRAVNFYINSK
ncbi:hypothetical protein LVD17_03130 [Fulvivirga ulvae]|uniref:hypothetical protein n=1 Tax=Fulvivirga ulvae TaxID=2904245 RepID=UPI001F2CBED7|nr:hypothetical protein [Fulvivirga ulvae]UII32825.1 hypothetical protein LVD17_03130 [Fulvivirga ulvae]